jgi:hypothetical protein
MSLRLMLWYALIAGFLAAVISIGRWIIRASSMSTHAIPPQEMECHVRWLA